MSSAGALRWLGYSLRCGLAVEKDRDSREDKEMQFAGFTYRIWLRANDGETLTSAEADEAEWSGSRDAWKANPTMKSRAKPSGWTWLKTQILKFIHCLRRHPNLIWNRYEPERNRTLNSFQFVNPSWLALCRNYSFRKWWFKIIHICLQTQFTPLN